MSTPPALAPITLPAGPYLLRPFEAQDTSSVVEAAQDPLIPLITTVPSPCDEAAAQAFLARQHARLTSGQGYSLAIAEPAPNGSGPALGQIGLWPREQGRASVGYWVLERHRGRGIAKHALQAISAFGLAKPELWRLELYIEPWNAASCRTAERVGYQREGLLRRYQQEERSGATC